jgi:hypothetical protein
MSQAQASREGSPQALRERVDGPSLESPRRELRPPIGKKPG